MGNYSSPPEARPSRGKSRAATPTLSEVLDETARLWPGRVGFATQASSITFSELRAQALKMAAALRARGVKKGDCVGLVLRNSPEFIVSYFGLVRLGAIAVPINFLITKPEELRFMLDDCAAVGVVTQPEFLKGLLAARRDLQALRWIWSMGADGAQVPSAAPSNGRGRPDDQGPEDLRRFIDSGDPATLPSGPLGSPEDVTSILYTSGTTGTPKGVMLTHANIVSNVDACIKVMQVDSREVALCLLPMFHTFSWMANVLIPLRIGAKSVIVGSIAPPLPWLKLMARHGVTMFAAVPPIYSVLARELKGLKGLVMKYWFFRKVRLCVSGAAPLPAETASGFERAMGLPILEGYGLTETSPVATLNPPARLRRGSVGLPIQDVRIKIVDDQERELPVGSEGEICIRGPNIMLGYHKRPEATREAFTRDGWFKSGDIGALDTDGFLFIRDRKKDMIIVKGLKVFSAQVEQVLTTHPDVAEAAIVGVPEETGDELIKAFIVLREGAVLDKSTLMQFCREKLDAYKRPRDLEIVSSLPKNALQKVLKRALRQQEIDKRKA